MLDVHLMIERPERQIAEFAEAGADSITVHAEATPHLHYALHAVKEAGCAAGAAINPGTPVERSPRSPTLDLALCMSVNPGWGGQPFIAASLDKMARLRARWARGRRRDRGRRRRRPVDRGPVRRRGR